MGSPRLIVFGRGALCAAEALSPGAAVGRELVALRRVLRRVWAGHSPRLGSLLSRVSVPVYVCTHTLSLGSSRWHPPDRSALGRGVYMCVCRYDVYVCRCVSCVWCMGVLGGASVPRPYAPPTVMCCTPTRNNKRHLPRRATRLSVSPRWPARAKTGKTASALRISDLRSTDSTCSSSIATWNDVRFELKHRARMGAT